MPRRLTAVILATAILIPALSYSSTPAHFGKREKPLPDSLWTAAEWISVADAPVVTGRIDDNTLSADGASIFLFNLSNDKKISKATWMASGLGVFELFVNGKPVGEEILKPGFTHHEKTKLSFTYDVTDCLRTRKGDSNLFIAQLTPGWWGDKIVTPGGHDGMIGKKTAFRSIIEITYSDGSKKYYHTNPTDWKATLGGPVTHSGIFDGVAFDSRITLPHFDSNLPKPEINTEFHGHIFPSEGAEVYFRDDLALNPVEIYSWKGTVDNSEDCFGKVNIVKEWNGNETISLKPGETLVVDFGQNAAAVPKFIFKGKAGTKLTCLPGELLNDGNGAKSRGMDGPEGSVHRLNLRIPELGMRLDYIFSDTDGFETFRPSTTFFGYRYISVTADNEVLIKKVVSIPVSSISSALETGEIVTGNPDINRLISNIRWGQLSNYLSVPTDCPQRNERLGWTADTQVFAETGTFFADTKQFFHKWMRDMRDTQSPSGGFPGVAPLAQYGASPKDMTRLGWADAGVIVPWVIWKQYDDTDIVRENWDALNKFVRHIRQTEYNHNALIQENDNFQWADWLSYEPLESCGGLHITHDENGNNIVNPAAIDYWNYLSACYWLQDELMMADMASSIGENPDEYYEAARKAKHKILTEFIDDRGNFRNEILNTMQTPALFALHNNVVDGQAKANMIERLRANFEEHDNCLQTGFLGTSILMPTLSANGMTDIAYRLLYQRKNPSWLYSVDNGATTIWERWNSYMKDKGMGPQGMNSFNHYAYGCVGEWLWKTAAGIAADPTSPGFKKIVMKPCPDKNLGWLKASYNSPQGLIRSEWKYEGDKWIWHFSIPEGSVALVTLPGQDECKEYPSGTHQIAIDLK